MDATSAIKPNFAKSRTEACFGNRRRALRLNAAVMQKSRDLFSVKTAHHLAEITGYSVRACEAWLSERVVIPSDALAALIQSEWGREYLVSVMADNTPRFWLQLKAWWSSIDYAAAEIKHRRKLRELLDDKAAAEAATPQDSTAHIFQDGPFYLGQPSPYRAMAPAPSKGRRR